MQDYTFEYTRQRVAYFLLGLSFAIIGLGLFLLKILFKDVISPGLSVITLIGLAIVFFLLNKQRIKRIAIAKLSKTDLTIEMNQTIHIAFSDLKYYYIYDGKKGTVFTLGFTDGTKFKIGANNRFCNNALLKTFLTDFQSTIESYKAQNKVNIVHLETIFARKQTPYILSTMTILVILGFCFTHMPLMIVPIGVSASLLVGWIKYFQQRNKDKLVDF